MNIEDYVSKSTGKPNVKFDRVMDLFMQRCGARMHWGKAGWPRLNKCFDGAAVYPNSWCDFGCAVQQLDPTGKFRTESPVWQWKATKGGVPTDFASCCTPQGFDKTKCQCASAPACGAQPAVAAAQGKKP